MWHVSSHSGEVCCKLLYSIYLYLYLLIEVHKKHIWCIIRKMTFSDTTLTADKADAAAVDHYFSLLTLTKNISVLVCLRTPGNMLMDVL